MLDAAVKRGKPFHLDDIQWRPDPGNMGCWMGDALPASWPEKEASQREIIDLGNIGLAFAQLDYVPIRINLLQYNTRKSVLIATNFWQNGCFEFPGIYRYRYLVRRSNTYESWYRVFPKAGRV